MGYIFLITSFLLAQASLQKEVLSLSIFTGEINKLSGEENGAIEEFNVEKRDIPFDYDDGSGAILNARRSNRKGYIKAEKLPNNYNADFVFDNDNDNDNTTETNEETITTKSSPDIVTFTSTKTPPTTTTTTPQQTSTIKIETTSKETAIVTTPSCHNVNCENHTAIIQPNHVTEEIGSTFNLRCLFDDKNGNAIFPTNGKVVWTIDRYQIPPVEVHEPTLTIINSTVLDSGIYACLLKSEDGCCSSKIYIAVNIYQKPDYALHLLITGAICGVQLLACIPFLIYRRRKVYAYTKTDENEVDDEQKLIA